MKSISNIIIVILLAIIAFGGYKFIIQGSVQPASDGRTAILLSDTERNLVLAEMRDFLASVQQINHGLATENMELVVEAAKKVGREAQAQVPGTLMGKLPLAFKKLGSDTHQKFDLLALDADSLADVNQTLTQLSTLMQNCVACHEAFRIDLESSDH